MMLTHKAVVFAAVRIRTDVRRGLWQSDSPKGG